MPDILELVFCRDLLIEPTSPVRLANVSQSNSTSAFSLTTEDAHDSKTICRGEDPSAGVERTRDRNAPAGV